MSWRELGWFFAILAGFALVYMPWGTLMSWAKEEMKARPKDVI